MIRLRLVAFGAAALLVAVSPLSAHHVWPVDRAKALTLTGTVTGYDWSNPHVMIGLEVKAANGKVEKWNVGGPSLARMVGNGWDKNTLKPGDAITATGYRFSDGSNILRLEKIVMANGKEMFLYGSR